MDFCHPKYFLTQYHYEVAGEIILRKDLRRILSASFLKFLSTATAWKDFAGGKNWVLSLWQHFRIRWLCTFKNGVEIKLSWCTRSPLDRLKLTHVLFSKNCKIWQRAAQSNSLTQSLVYLLTFCPFNQKLLTKSSVIFGSFLEAIAFNLAVSGIFSFLWNISPKNPTLFL